MNLKKLSLILLLSTIIACGDNETNKSQSDTNTKSDEKKEIKSEFDELADISNAKQLTFLNDKAILFKKCIVEPESDESEKNFEKITKDYTVKFVNESKNEIINWTGKVGVLLTDESGKMQPNQSLNTCVNLSIDFGQINFDENYYAASGMQRITPKHPLYKKVKELSDDDKVTISAKIKKFEDVGDFYREGKEYRKFEVQTTSFDLEINSIEKL